MLSLRRKRFESSTILFLLLLLVYYVLVGFHHVLFQGPQGIHFIRQTDSLSFASHYYLHGFHFFEPGVFSLYSYDGKAVSEFPIIYFFVAVLYKLFGEHTFFLRLINLIITSAGFLALFKISAKFLSDKLLAISFCFIIISSTVLLYYTNNFIPDTPAFGLVCLGWYFFFSYLEKREMKFYFICMFFFAFSSLLKITCLMNPVAAWLTLIFATGSLPDGWKTIFRSGKKESLVILFVLLATCFWGVYANYYNHIHQDFYFLTGIKPIWNSSPQLISEVKDAITNYWYTSYYYQSTFHFIAILTVLGFLFARHSERILFFPSVLLLLASMAYFFLFFAQFRDHDYYFITTLPAIFFLTLNSLVTLKKKFPAFGKGIVIKIAVTVMAVLSLNYARPKIIKRFNDVNDPFSVLTVQLKGMKAFLSSNGVREDARFIIIPDKTPNGGLYLINHSGWAVADTSEKGKTDLKYAIALGADYILYTDSMYYDRSLKGEVIAGPNGTILLKIR